MQLHWKMLFIRLCEHIEETPWFDDGKNKNFRQIMRFPIWWSDKKSKTLKLYRQKLRHAMNGKKLLFKVGPNTILPKQRNIWPNKSFREWPKIPKYRFLWKNSEMGGIWHYWCSTTNKNDQLFQLKWERNRKNKKEEMKTKQKMSS